MPKLFSLTLLTFLVFQACESQQEERTVFDVLTPVLRLFKGGLEPGIKRIIESRVNRQQLESLNKAAKKYMGDFPCNLTVASRSAKVPKTAHEVRPADIDVIGAIGDSLTAGSGISATSILLELNDDRGKSFSIGGQGDWRSYLTLPNILKEFNPNLFGYARGASITVEPDSQFNVAEIGAISSDMPFMANVLVQRMKEDPRVDINNHWKLITHMIGANDFSTEICYYKNPYDVLEKHRQDLIKVLRTFRDNLPRTIVIVLPPPNLEEITRWNDLSPICVVSHSFFSPCIKGVAFKKKQKMFFDIMKKWQQIDIEVSDMPEFDLDDFTVITPLFFSNYTVPKTDRGTTDYGYFAPDCFHFSEKGHAKVANDLWNSLLEPFGNKSTDGTEFLSKFNCPTEEHPYIFTRRNSIKITKTDP
nr:phospholipase B1, membrane-associated-like [Leptinotarsa decemlineata]XP_023012796.1 phospholipase B1, membrane-associated-like [Leptinotarsa decemlineata]